jgi:4-coumarate--CoA ligase
MLLFVSSLTLSILEVVYQIQNTEAKIILAHQNNLPRAIAAAKLAGLPAEAVIQFSNIPNPNCHGVQNWLDVIGSEQEVALYHPPKFTEKQACETIASINYSSGTTGVPKGVCVSHYNIIANSEQTIHIREMGKGYSTLARPTERWIGFLPLYHAYGQLYSNVMIPKLRHEIYIMENFVYADFLSIIQNQKITHLQVAPPILVMLSKRPETAKYDLSSVTDILCGAAPLSKELQNDLMERFNVQINQGWGMTEVTCGAIHVPGGIRDQSGSVGVLDSNCEAKLLDDEGNEVAIGERGELFIRGPQVCLGYWRNDEATKENIDDEGWLKTGDVAICNDKEWFWIVDRKKVRFTFVSNCDLNRIICRHAAGTHQSQRITSCTS